MDVLGVQFPNPHSDGGEAPDRRTEISACTPGERVTLLPLPIDFPGGGPIAVYSDRGIQIGYISAEHTLIVHRAIAEAKPIRAIFQEATVSGCEIRVTFDGSEPVIPRSRTRASADDLPADDGWIPPDG